MSRAHFTSTAYFRLFNSFFEIYIPTCIHKQIQNILYIQSTRSWLTKTMYKKVEMRSHKETSCELGQPDRIPIKKALLKVK